MCGKSAAMNATSEHNLAMDLGNVTDYLNFGKPILDFATLQLLIEVNFYLFAFPLSTLGVITNTANLIVYYKMGFSESSNINFFALSTFDFLFSLTSLVGRMFYGPLFRGTSFFPVVQYIGGSLSRVLFVTICGSAMMTALISTERCLCVVFPLKVKTWLTQKRSLCLMLTVLTYHVIFLIILYADPGPPYDVYSPKDAFYYFSLYAVPLNICFFAIILNTSFLVIRLRVSQKWRKGASLQGKGSQNNSKGNKLARTIISISILFIFCSSPTVGFFIAQLIYPRFNYSDIYFGTVNTLLQDYNAICQIVSSSTNIFFYYHMSSRFKKVFCDTFACKKSKKIDGSQSNPSS